MPRPRKPTAIVELKEYPPAELTPQLFGSSREDRAATFSTCSWNSREAASCCSVVTPSGFHGAGRLRVEDGNAAAFFSTSRASVFGSTLAFMERKNPVEQLRSLRRLEAILARVIEKAPILPQHLRHAFACQTSLGRPAVAEKPNEFAQL